MARLVLNKKKLRTPYKTVPVIGLARSGTTMVANMLKTVGVPMGVTGGEEGAHVAEDVAISELIDHHAWTPEIHDMIQERNAKHNIWGWKKPGSYRRMKWMQDGLRNPHFVVVVRDLTAIAQRRTMSRNVSFSEARDEILEQHYDLIKYIDDLRFPVYVFSYEWAMMNKEEFAESIFDFLDMEVSQEEFEKAVNSIGGGGKEAYMMQYQEKRIKQADHKTNTGVVRRGGKPNSDVKDVLITGLHRLELKGIHRLLTNAGLKPFNKEDPKENIEHSRFALFTRFGKSFLDTFNDGRNVHIIHMNTDLLSFACRFNKDHGINLMEALVEEHKWMKRFNVLKCPSLMVSHEKLQLKRGSVVQSISDFIDIPIPLIRTQLFTPQVYAENLYSVDGSITEVHDGVIKGWIITHDNKVHKEELGLYEDGVLIEEQVIRTTDKKRAKAKFEFKPKWDRYKERLEIKTSEGITLNNGEISL